MDNKRLILIIGCIVAVALVCVLIVGMINGVWPWQNNDFSGEYTGTNSSGEAGAADETGDTTTGGSGDATENTVDSQGNGTGNGTENGTGGNGTGNSQPQKPSVGVETGATEGTEETLPDSAIIDFEDLLAGLNGNG